MLKKFLSSFLLVFPLLLGSADGFHDVSGESPDVLIKEIVRKVMTAVQADPGMKAGRIEKIEALVHAVILPHADFEKTTELVMGNHWLEASAAQRQEIMQAFEGLLIRTYAGGIRKIRNQEVQFGPVRFTTPRLAMVPTTVINEGKKLSIHYYLTKNNDGWKVYDMNILGIRLINAFKPQFQDQINSSGINGLIRYLKKKNQEMLSSHP